MLSWEFLIAEHDCNTPLLLFLLSFYLTFMLAALEIT